MKFIHCFSEELKEKLLQAGFELLSQNGSLFIFENNPSLQFNFEKLDGSKFILSNKLIV